MIEIVRAKEEHEQELGNLWMEFMRFSQDIDPIHSPKDDAVSTFIEEYLRPAMKAENSLVLVALDERRAVGYSYSLICEPVNLVKREKYGCIHDVYISAVQRRKGIGEKMLGEIMKWFRSRHIERVELDVMAQNQVASSFWEKHGFMDFQRTLCRRI